MRRRLLDRLVAKARPLDEARLGRPTLVLAPHPDDEALGCGGLISLLRQRGTAVQIVFMTDGAGSHPDIPTDRLIATRRSEAIAASAKLGVDEAHLHFLDHPDGQLAAAETDATRELVGVIADMAPEQIVVPHPFEPNHDHSATFRIADGAVRAGGRPIDALLVAIWWWDQWPWTNPWSSPRGRLSRRSMLEAAHRGRLGFGFGQELTHIIDVSEVFDRKQAALAAHTSQTADATGDLGGPTLADISGGDWLDLLMRPHELYGLATLGSAGEGGAHVR